MSELFDTESKFEPEAGSRGKWVSEGKLRTGTVIGTVVGSSGKVERLTVLEDGKEGSEEIEVGQFTKV